MTDEPTMGPVPAGVGSSINPSSQSSMTEHAAVSTLDGGGQDIYLEAAESGIEKERAAARLKYQTQLESDLGYFDPNRLVYERGRLTRPAPDIGRAEREAARTMVPRTSPKGASLFPEAFKEGLEKQYKEWAAEQANLAILQARNPVTGSGSVTGRLVAGMMGAPNASWGGLPDTLAPEQRAEFQGRGFAQRLGMTYPDYLQRLTPEDARLVQQPAQVRAESQQRAEAAFAARSSFISQFGGTPEERLTPSDLFAWQQQAGVIPEGAASQEYRDWQARHGIEVPTKEGERRERIAAQEQYGRDMADWARSNIEAFRPGVGESQSFIEPGTGKTVWMRPTGEIWKMPTPPEKTEMDKSDEWIRGVLNMKEPTGQQKQVGFLPSPIFAPLERSMYMHPTTFLTSLAIGAAFGFGMPGVLGTIESIAGPASAEMAGAAITGSLALPYVGSSIQRVVEKGPGELIDIAFTELVPLSLGGGIGEAGFRGVRSPIISLERTTMFEPDVIKSVGLRTTKGPVESFAEGITWNEGRFTGTVQVGQNPEMGRLIFGREAFYPKTPLESGIIGDILGAEGRKIILARELQTYSSGMQAREVTPIIADILTEHGIPKPREAAVEIVSVMREAAMKGGENQMFYGSMVQKAVSEEALSRAPRDIDVMISGAEQFTTNILERVGKVSGRDVLKLEEGNIVGPTGEKLFDIHRADVAPYAEPISPYVGYGIKTEPRVFTEERVPVISFSEQLTRKAVGTMEFSTKPRTLIEEGTGIEITGRLTPEHGGRIKDIQEYYFGKKADILAIEKTRPILGRQLEPKLEEFISLFGEKKAEAVKAIYLEKVGKEGTPIIFDFVGNENVQLERVAEVQGIQPSAQGDRLYAPNKNGITSAGEIRRGVGANIYASEPVGKTSYLDLPIRAAFAASVGLAGLYQISGARAAPSPAAISLGPSVSTKPSRIREPSKPGQVYIPAPASIPSIPASPPVESPPPSGPVESPETSPSTSPEEYTPKYSSPYTPPYSPPSSPPPYIKGYAPGYNPYENTYGIPTRSPPKTPPITFPDIPPWRRRGIKSVSYIETHAPIAYVTEAFYGRQMVPLEPVWGRKSMYVTTEGEYTKKEVHDITRPALARLRGLVKKLPEGIKNIRPSAQYRSSDILGMDLGPQGAKFDIIGPGTKRSLSRQARGTQEARPAWTLKPKRRL